MKMKSLLVVALISIPQILFAGNLSSKFSVMSDYIDRGLSLTDHGPAALADMHYNFDFGLGLGTSVANTGTDGEHGMQNRTDISFIYPLNTILALKTKLQYFYNPYATQADIFDIQVGAQITKYFAVTAFYSPKYNGTGKSAARYEAESDIEILPSEHLYLNLLGAYNTSEEPIRTGHKNYFDYKIAVHRQVQETHDISIFWVGTNRRLIDETGFDKPAQDEGFGGTYTVHFH